MAGAKISLGCTSVCSMARPSARPIDARHSRGAGFSVHTAERALTPDAAPIITRHVRFWSIAIQARGALPEFRDAVAMLFSHGRAYFRIQALAPVKTGSVIGVSTFAPDAGQPLGWAIHCDVPRQAGAITSFDRRAAAAGESGGANSLRPTLVPYAFFTFGAAVVIDAIDAGVCLGLAGAVLAICGREAGDAARGLGIASRAVRCLGTIAVARTFAASADIREQLGGIRSPFGARLRA